MADETKDTGVGNPNKGLLNDDLNIELKDQPIEERLRYSGTATSLHSRVLSRLMARRKMSERVMSRRYEAFGRVDEHCRLFIDLSRQAKNADGTTDPDKKEMPWARSIVVPMSYAILQVYLTQLIGIFTRRDPPIEIYGRGSEDVRPAKLMNAIIAYDQVQTNYTLELYTALQDAMKYGMGGFHDSWYEEYGYKMDKASRWASPVLKMLGMPTKRRIWGKRVEFNRVEAWDPYNFFPDPRISLSNIQRGEFWGHRLWRGYLEIESQSQRNGGPYFNTNQVRLLSPKPQALRQRNRFAMSQMNLIGSMDERDRGFHALDSMMAYIIPEEWHLGDGDRPELWQFAWVDDQCIIRAHPSEYEHFQANYSAFESNIDTHVFGNQGSIENLDGLQRFMCYSEDTEILTQRGWLNFADLTQTDRVATVSADANRDLTFETPRGFYSYDYEGDMIHIGGKGRNRRFDLLVTPNHRMWVQKRKAKTHRTQVEGNTVRVYDDQWWTDGEFITADKMRPWFRLPTTVSWDGGVDSGEFVLPAIESPIGRIGRKYKYPEFRVSYDTLASFLGWYLSEGHTWKDTVRLSQKKPEWIPEIDRLLAQFPKKFTRCQEKGGAIRWQLYDRRLAEWLRTNCGERSEVLRVPEIAKSFSPRLIRLMISAAIKGDGHQYRDNLSIYFSTSEQLVDDLQIEAMKAGFYASVRRAPKPRSSRHRQAYTLLLNINGDASQAAGISRVPYKGKIYCVENSTHLLLVRRNGRAVTCGNSWCWNSHIQNQVRWLNNRALYDPSLIESFDMENPDAALHVRLTALGQSLIREGKVRISDMYQQMKMGDVTVGLVQSVNQMFDFAMRASGAADQMMGQVTQDKRTLGEVQRVGHEGSMRMAMHASMLDYQGMRQTILRWVSNRQQLTTMPQWVRIVGDMMAEFGGDRFQVKPEDLEGNYDYVPKTGPEPPDPGQMAQVMVDGLGMILKDPGILQIPDKNGKTLDPHEWIKEILRERGIKNPDDFYRAVGGQPGQQMPGTNVQVMPDEQVAKQEQAGNILPFPAERVA